MKNLFIGVGNIYLDHNVFGVDNSRGDRLDSGTDYFAQSGEIVVGGSAINFLLQAKSLGFDGTFVGKVGNDEFGHKVKNLLEEGGISSELIVTTNEDKTGVSINMVFAHDGNFTGVHFGEASRFLKPEDIDLNHRSFNKAMLVYFGGTAKQEYIFNNLPQILSSLKEKGIKIAVDPNRFVSGADKKKEIFTEALKYVDFYLPNETEIRQAMGEENLDKAIDAALSAGAGVVVVKMGPKGCRIKTKDKDVVVSGFKLEPLTTVGAGDCFNAAFLTQYLQGMGIKEAARFANATAAIRVSKNIRPDAATVQDFLEKS